MVSWWEKQIQQAYPPNVYSGEYPPYPFLVLTHKRNGAYLFEMAHDVLASQRNEWTRPSVIPDGMKEYFWRKVSFNDGLVLWVRWSGIITL